MVTTPPLLNQGTNGVVNYGSMREYPIYNSGTSGFTFTNDYDIYSGINSPFAYFYNDNGLAFFTNVGIGLYYFDCSNILLNNIIVTGTSITDSIVISDPDNTKFTGLIVFNMSFEENFTGYIVIDFFSYSSRVKYFCNNQKSISFCRPIVNIQNTTFNIFNLTLLDNNKNSITYVNIIDYSIAFIIYDNKNIPVNQTSYFKSCDNDIQCAAKSTLYQGVHYTATQMTTDRIKNMDKKYLMIPQGYTYIENEQSYSYFPRPFTFAGILIAMITAQLETEAVISYDSDELNSCIIQTITGEYPKYLNWNPAKQPGATYTFAPVINTPVNYCHKFVVSSDLNTNNKITVDTFDFTMNTGVINDNGNYILTEDNLIKDIITNSVYNDTNKYTPEQSSKSKLQFQQPRHILMAYFPIESDTIFTGVFSMNNEFSTVGHSNIAGDNFSWSAGTITLHKRYYMINIMYTLTSYSVDSLIDSCIHFSLDRDFTPGLTISVDIFRSDPDYLNFDNENLTIVKFIDIGEAHYDNGKVFGFNFKIDNNENARIKITDVTMLIMGMEIAPNGGLKF